MSRLFDDASTHYLQNSSAVLNALPISISCWFKSDDLTANQTLVSIGDTSTTTSFVRLMAAGAVSGDPVRVQHYTSAANSGANSSSSYPTGTWTHAGGVFASLSSRTAYIDGVAGTEDTTALGAQYDWDVTSVGVTARSTLLNYMSGDISQVGIWDVVLTDEEMAILALGVSPLLVRPGSLIAYFPLGGNDSPEIDPVGGYDLTVTGATKSDSPRIILPSSSDDSFGAYAANTVTGTADIDFGSFTVEGYGDVEDGEVISGYGVIDFGAFTVEASGLVDELPMPTNVKATTIDTVANYEVILTWDDYADIDYYKVYINGTFSANTVAGINMAVISASNLTDLYSVSAIVLTGATESEISNQVIVTLPTRKTLFRHSTSKRSKRIN